MTQRSRELRWEVAGHSEAVSAVAAAVESERVPHAWLITGTEGVGRTTLALALARALNCDAAPWDRPCGECRSCRHVTARSHPDVTVADMAWQRELVGSPSTDKSRARQRFSIDAIRLLRADIVTRPILGRWKVQILDDAGLFSTDAPAAFLKTLEEPPPYAVIILIAQSPEQVPETVRSRCRHVSLGLVQRDEIVAELVRRGADQSRAMTLTRVARGRIAWAIDALSDPQATLRRRETVEAAYEHMTTPLGRAAITGVIAGSHTQRRDATYAFVDLWMGLWRDALYLRTGLSEQVQYPEVADRLVAWTRAFQIEEIYHALSSTRRCAQDLDANVQARIALQAMVTQWPG